MTTKYAFGILENRHAEYTFWIVADGDNNHDAYGAFAEAIDYHYGDDFTIAGILGFLKENENLSNLSVGVTTPRSDHTLHVYDAVEQTVSLYTTDDEDDLLVTFPLKQWTAKYL